MVDSDDPNLLARRAEVLQRIADQLSNQLEVERRSNEELRSLAGEPSAWRAGDQARAAAQRFMTFAAVAVVTAAAVAALVARPWHSSKVSLSGPPDVRLQAPVQLLAVKSALVPFSVVSTPRASYPLRRDCFLGPAGISLEPPSSGFASYRRECTLGPEGVTLEPPGELVLGHDAALLGDGPYVP